MVRPHDFKPRCVIPPQVCIIPTQSRPCAGPFAAQIVITPEVGKCANGVTILVNLLTPVSYIRKPLGCTKQRELSTTCGSDRNTCVFFLRYLHHDMTQAVGSLPFIATSQCKICGHRDTDRCLSKQFDWSLSGSFHRSSIHSFIDAM